MIKKTLEQRISKLEKLFEKRHHKVYERIADKKVNQSIRKEIEVLIPDEDYIIEWDTDNLDKDDVMSFTVYPNDNSDDFIDFNIKVNGKRFELSCINNARNSKLGTFSDTHSLAKKVLDELY